MPIGPDHDRPMEHDDGLNAGRERRWGRIGGATGAAFGVLAFAISAWVDHADVHELAGSPYPPFLGNHHILAFDGLLLGGLVAGMALLGYGLFALRRGRYPRTDGYGAVLTGTILTVLSGLLAFLRVWAILHTPYNVIL